MYEPRRKIFWFAIISRLTVLILQFVFNTLCPDHQADAFRSPTDYSDRVSVYDKIVTVLFSGLTRWDGEYFIHIAKYGYTYENTLAFYPMYPMLVRIFGTVIKRICFVLNIHSAMVLAAALINFICFVKSAVIFYDLSKAVMEKTSTAYKASILYCINPATIFFSAAYSESLFAYLTYYCMLRSINLDPYVFFPLGLSMLVRSNGIVNIGFPIYFRFIKLCHSCLTKQKNYSFKTLCYFMFKVDTLLSCCSMCNIIVTSVAPLVLSQIYNYVIFCIPNSTRMPMPSYIINYATINNLVLPGNGSAEWCQAKIPIAYSYIQGNYWNVGFLKYYQLKQIPNFILAIPILFIMSLCIREYFLEHQHYVCSLGFLKKIEDKSTTKIKKYPVGMFVFIIHGLFLTIFCMLFMHIQVSTRFLCSSSPLIYWYCALTMSNSFHSDNNPHYENEENITSKWRVFFLSQKKYFVADKLILIYFLGYAIAGCFMFSNFLPWT